jgi:hypothetical protein
MKAHILKLTACAFVVAAGISKPASAGLIFDATIPTLAPGFGDASRDLTPEPIAQDAFESGSNGLSAGSGAIEIDSLGIDPGNGVAAFAFVVGGDEKADVDELANGPSTNSGLEASIGGFAGSPLSFLADNRVLTGPVAGICALMLAGVGALVWVVRRRQAG